MARGAHVICGWLWLPGCVSVELSEERAETHFNATLRWRGDMYGPS